MRKGTRYIILAGKRYFVVAFHGDYREHQWLNNTLHDIRQLSVRHLLGPSLIAALVLLRAGVVWVGWGWGVGGSIDVSYKSQLVSQNVAPGNCPLKPVAL